MLETGTRGHHQAFFTEIYYIIYIICHQFQNTYNPLYSCSWTRTSSSRPISLHIHHCLLWNHLPLLSLSDCISTKIYLMKINLQRIRKEASSGYDLRKLINMILLVYFSLVFCIKSESDKNTNLMSASNCYK